MSSIGINTNLVPSHYWTHQMVKTACEMSFHNCTMAWDNSVNVWGWIGKSFNRRRLSEETAGHSITSTYQLCDVLYAVVLLLQWCDHVALLSESIMTLLNKWTDRRTNCFSRNAFRTVLWLMGQNPWIVCKKIIPLKAISDMHKPEIMN